MRQFRVFGKGIAKAVFALRKVDCIPPPTEVARREEVLAKFAVLRAREVPPDEAAFALGASLRSIRRWQTRMREGGVCALANESRRPLRMRSAEKRADISLRLAVKEIRNEYPFGKAKIGVLLRREGREVSDSTIGRILSDLRRRRQIAPVRIGKHKRVCGGKETRPHAVRWQTPAAFALPGECVLMDTMQIALAGGRRAYVFTAVDGHSRRAWTMPAANADAKSAAAFLRRIADGFPVRSVQTDGGSEFRAAFEGECARRGIVQVVLPPRSPK